MENAPNDIEVLNLAAVAKWFKVYRAEPAPQDKDILDVVFVPTLEAPHIKKKVSRLTFANVRRVWVGNMIYDVGEVLLAGTNSDPDNPKFDNNAAVTFSILKRTPMRTVLLGCIFFEDKRGRQVRVHRVKRDVVQSMQK